MRLRSQIVGCAVLSLVVVWGERCAVAADDAAPDPFAKWEKAIAAFEQKDRENPPPQNSVLFVGSSSIVRWDLTKSFPAKPYINRGFGGSQIVDSTHFADRVVLKHKPRKVFLYAGDNDLARGKSPEQVEADFKAFVAKVHGELPETEIAFIAIKPSLSRWKLIDAIRDANARIAAICEKNPLLTYIDVVEPMLGDNGMPRKELFVKDGLHLSEAGYELWTSIIEPHLKPAATEGSK